MAGTWEDRNHLAVLVSASRGMRGHSQQDLADRLPPLTKREIGKLERSMIFITRDMIALPLADYIGVPVDAIYEMCGELPEDIRTRMRSLTASQFQSLRRFLDTIVPLSGPFIPEPGRRERAVLTSDQIDRLNEERGYPVKEVQ